MEKDKRCEVLMKIEIKSDTSLYITINGYVYYIDDSTNEQIIDKWKDEDEDNWERLRRINRYAKTIYKNIIGDEKKG